MVKNNPAKINDRDGIVRIIYLAVKEKEGDVVAKFIFKAIIKLWKLEMRNL